MPLGALLIARRVRARGEALRCACDVFASAADDCEPTPVKSRTQALCTQSCTTSLSPALSVCRWPRGGVARRNRKRTRGTRLSRDVRCVDRYNRKGSLHDGAEPSIHTSASPIRRQDPNPSFPIGPLFPPLERVLVSRRSAPLLAVLDAPAAMLMTKAHRMAILAYLFKEVRASTARLADGLAPGGRHGPL
jgi:hypothetical protein